MLVPNTLFQLTLMFEDKAEAYPRVENLKVLHLERLSGEAFQGQTL